MSHEPLPTIIQGGMGAGVSGYRLANAVARAGQLGVVSGTALDVILPRRLQVGDPGGDMRRAERPGRGRSDPLGIAAQNYLSGSIGAQALAEYALDLAVEERASGIRAG